MSGRLIILANKGYCPWNTQNLARIRRDEEEYRKAEEREQEKQANKASALRLVGLKKTRNDKDKHQKRFSLFESEETESYYKSNQLQGSKSEVCKRKSDIQNEGRTSKNKERKPDDFPYRCNRLGRHSVTKQVKTNAFYLKARPVKEPLESKEIQRKRDMDPMREFHEDQEIKQGISHRKMVQSIKSGSAEEISQREKRKQAPEQHESSYHSSTNRNNVFNRGMKHDKHRKKKKSRHREDCRSRKHKKSSRSKKEKWNRSNHNFNHTDSIEELRKKRAEREEQERLRCDVFLITAQNLDEEKY